MLRFSSVLAGMILAVFLGCNSAEEEKPVNSQPAEPELTPTEHVAQAKAHMAVAKLQLKKEGEYSCCIENPCNQCLLEHESCSCGKSVVKDRPVCSECYAGWKRGEGKFDDVDPEHVQTSFSSHRHD